MADNDLKIDRKTYKEGMYITIEGKDESDTFYIVREGNVKLEQETDENEPPIEEMLEEGDYFGVVSCMSGHPRTESAHTESDVVVFVIEKDQYGPFVKKHPKAAIKILNKMSKQLRAYDEELSQRTHGETVKTNDEEEEDGQGLYDVATYYFNKKKYNQALYAFVRYVEHYKEGPHFEDAKDKISKLTDKAKAAMNPQNQDGGMVRTYKNDTFLFCEDEPGSELFIIQEGKVKITKVEKGNEALLAEVTSGAPIGEMAILENKPRSASAIAFGDVKVLAVNKDNFESMVQSQPQMATKIMTALSDRIWGTYRHLACIRIADPLARLWDVLLYHCQKERVEIKRGASYTFKFGPKELTEYAALPQDQGRKIVQQMFENKTLTLDGDHIRVEDLEKLQQEVDFYRKKMHREQKIAASKQK